MNKKQLLKALREQNGIELKLMDNSGTYPVDEYLDLRCDGRDDGMEITMDGNVARYTGMQSTKTGMSGAVFTIVSAN